MTSNLFDVLISKGKIIDGSGNPWFKANIGIRSEKIVKIGEISSSDSEITIDAENLIVCPGFIDMHAHSDIPLIVNPKAESKIHQGVTTEVIGNCGGSAAPLIGPNFDDYKERTEKKYGIKLKWTTIEQYFKLLESQGIAVNVVPLLGYKNVRIAVLGYEQRDPNDQELALMKMIVSQAMENGMYGMSTGLYYSPQSYAKTEEIIELCKVVAKYGGKYHTHMRDEADRGIEALIETIKIGEESFIPVQISHHKAFGKQNWGKCKESIRLIEEARKRGLDITYDLYPYIFCGTSLKAWMPNWMHEGGLDNLLDRLKEKNIRDKVKREMMDGSITGYKGNGWKRTIISSTEKHPEYEGKTFQEIADSINKDPFEFAFDLLIEEHGAVSILIQHGCEEDEEYLLKNHLAMIGSDGSSIAPYGILSKGKPHPRNYGAFPRVISKYVKERNIMTLEEAIRKMTSFPAQKLGIKNRGLLKEGMNADITIFNYDTIKDNLSLTNPHQYPDGVEHVIVNGTIVLDHHKHTGALTGKLLKAR